MVSDTSPWAIVPNHETLQGVLRAWERGEANTTVIWNVHLDVKHADTYPAIVCGQGILKAWLQNWSLSPQHIHQLGAQKSATGSVLYSEAFLNYLQRQTISDSIHILSEGTLCRSDTLVFQASVPLWQHLWTSRIVHHILSISSTFASAAFYRQPDQSQDAMPPPDISLSDAGCIDRALYISGQPPVTADSLAPTLVTCTINYRTNLPSAENANLPSANLHPLTGTGWERLSDPTPTLAEVRKITLTNINAFFHTSHNKQFGQT